MTALNSDVKQRKAIEFGRELVYDAYTNNYEELRSEINKRIGEILQHIKFFTCGDMAYDWKTKTFQLDSHMHNTYDPYRNALPRVKALYADYLERQARLLAYEIHPLTNHCKQLGPIKDGIDLSPWSKAVNAIATFLQSKIQATAAQEEALKKFKYCDFAVRLRELKAPRLMKLIHKIAEKKMLSNDAKATKHAANAAAKAAAKKEAEAKEAARIAYEKTPEFQLKQAQEHRAGFLKTYDSHYDFCLIKLTDKEAEEIIKETDELPSFESDYGKGVVNPVIEFVNSELKGQKKREFILNKDFDLRYRDATYLPKQANGKLKGFLDKLASVEDHRKEAAKLLPTIKQYDEKIRALDKNAVLVEPKVLPDLTPPLPAKTKNSTATPPSPKEKAPKPAATTAKTDAAPSDPAKTDTTPPTEKPKPSAKPAEKPKKESESTISWLCSWLCSPFVRLWKWLFG